MDMLEIWNQVLKNLEGNVSPVGFNIHIKTAVPVCFENSTFTISVATSINKNLVEYRYKKYIESSLEKVTGAKISLAVLVGDANELKQEIESKQNSEYDNSEIISSDGLNSKYTFENFVQGSSNLYAYTAAEQVANHPGESNNPLFIYGNSGLGKTHLMHAIGHSIMKEQNDAKVVYVSSEKFTNELINSIKSDKNEEFRNKYRNVDILLIDDIQFIAGKEGTQEEFFHTFNALHEANKQIIISSDRPPKEIPTLEDRLRSRFEMGLIADIQPPDFETRIAILKTKAQIENIDIPNEVMNYIATYIKSNIRELEGALTRVVAYSSLINKDISYDLAVEALKDIVTTSESQEISVNRIKEKVSTTFGIKMDDFNSKKRTRAIAYPRQIAMYLSRELTDLSLPKIGNEFGGRDHTTVIHAYEKISEGLKSDESLQRTIDDITKKITQK